MPALLLSLELDGIPEVNRKVLIYFVMRFVWDGLFA